MKMVVVNVQDVPVQVLDQLRIFLAASSRGEEAVLILETRKNKLTTKYRSVELLAGAPASTISSKPNRKVNPSRARRSKLRMELLTKRKLEEKKEQEEGSQELAPAEEVTRLATGDTSSTANRLVLDLSKDGEDKPDETGRASPIIQLDGDGDENQESEKKMIYAFSSDYAEKDIVETLKEFFPDESSIMPTLKSRVRTRRLSATHICTVELWFGDCAKERHELC